MAALSSVSYCISCIGDIPPIGCIVDAVGPAELAGALRRLEQGPVPLAREGGHVDPRRPQSAPGRPSKLGGVRPHEPAPGSAHVLEDEVELGRDEPQDLEPNLLGQFHDRVWYDLATSKLVAYLTGGRRSAARGRAQPHEIGQNAMVNCVTIVIFSRFGSNGACHSLERCGRVGLGLEVTGDDYLAVPPLVTLIKQEAFTRVGWHFCTARA